MEVVGYAGGSEVPVFTKTYTTDGAGSFTSFGLVPGDVAGLVRYGTADRSSKNHPIYLFNYYHGVGYQTGGSTAEYLNFNQKSAMATYATQWITGFSDGATTYTRCGPSGHLATGSVVEQYLTHRDLPH